MTNINTNSTNNTSTDTLDTNIPNTPQHTTNNNANPTSGDGSGNSNGSSRMQVNERSRGEMRMQVFSMGLAGPPPDGHVPLLRVRADTVYIRRSSLFFSLC